MSLGTSKRSRALIACERCKKRKRKCDGQHPCHGCSNSASICLYTTKRPNEDIDRLLTEANGLKDVNIQLTKQIQLLQEYIKTLENDRSMLQVALANQAPKKVVVKPDNQLSENIFTDILAKIMFKSSDENEYIGTFAFITIVTSIKNLLLGPEEQKSNMPIILEDLLGDEDSEVVSKRVEQEFINRFFSLAHNRVYFIDHVWFFNMLEKPTQERTRWDLFCYNMVLSLGCRLTELRRVTTFPQPEVYLRRALKELTNASLEPLQQIQACLLLAEFISKSYHLSFYVSAWELTGCASRKLVQFGYHRKQHLTLENSWNYEVIKRLFWSCYNYDKLLSLSLGRPCFIFDNFIEIPYPCSIDFPKKPTHLDYQKLYDLQLQEESDVNFKQPISELTSVIATSKIRMIESRIHLLLYSAKHTIPLVDTIDSLSLEIDNWLNSLPLKEEFDEVMRGRESYDFFHLLYNRARLILILPIIMSRSNENRDELLDQSCKAAGNICSCYLRLHKDSILEFSVLALHTVFLAGITMVYYLKWKGNPKFINVQKSLRDCSSLLLIFSERWPQAKSFSELFDDILEKVDALKRSSRTTPEQISSGHISPGLFGDPNPSNKDFWDQILEDIRKQANL